MSTQDRNNRLSELGVNVDAKLDDRSETAWRVLGGWQFAKNFAVEAGFTDLGTFKTVYEGRAQDIVTFLEDANRGLPHSAYGAEVSLVVNYPVFENLSLTGRLGGFFWNSEYEVEASNGVTAKHDDDGFDVLPGAGLEYSFASRVAVPAAWSHYDVDGENLNVVSLGVKYRFN